MRFFILHNIICRVSDQDLGPLSTNKKKHLSVESWVLDLLSLFYWCVSSTALKLVYCYTSSFNVVLYKKQSY